MIYSDIKFLNLFYILKDKFTDTTSTYIEYTPNIGIRVLTKDESLYEQIKAISYFRNNNFYITGTNKQLFPNLFYIHMKMDPENVKKLKPVYDDFIRISKTYDVDITLMYEKGFMIKEQDIEIVNEIYDELYERYNYTRFNNNHIFIIKSLQ